MQSDNSASWCVLVLDDQPDDYLKNLKQRFPTVAFDVCRHPAQIESALDRVRPHIVFGVVSRGMPGSVQRAILKSPRLKWIQSGNVGVDHLRPWPDQPVVVTNTAGVLSPFMAETVMGAMLMLNCGFHRYLAQQRDKKWRVLPWHPLRGKTVLIVGLGNIGRRVAAHAGFLGMHVLGLRRGGGGPLPGVETVISPADFQATLPGVDILCIHVPLTDVTRHMIDQRVFASLPKHAIVINTSRGGVVDEAALKTALQDGSIAAAYMDVFAEEPLSRNNPIWDAENLLITPHCSDTAHGWRRLLADFFAANLDRWLRGAPLKNVLDMQRGY